MNDAGRPVGFVSRADALAWQAQDVAPEETVGDRASDASLSVLNPGDVPSRALDPMLATGQGRIVVTDPMSGELVGLPAHKDLLQMRAATAAGEAECRVLVNLPQRRRVPAGAA